MHHADRVMSQCFVSPDALSEGGRYSGENAALYFFGNELHRKNHCDLNKLGKLVWWLGLASQQMNAIHCCLML